MVAAGHRGHPRLSAAEARAPAPADRDDRASTLRIVAVAAAYLAVVIPAVVLPMAFTHNPWPDSTADLQVYRLVLWILWLVVLVETMRRQPAGPMWYLIFAYVVAANAFFFAYLPSSLAFSVANLVGTLYLAILAHLMLAFPSGHLRERADRTVAGLWYVVIGVFSVVTVAFDYLPPDPRCGSQCYANLFLVWNEPALYDALLVLGFVIAVAAIPPVIVRLWVHWRDARPVARRAILPLLATSPFVVVAYLLDFAAERFSVTPLEGFYQSAAAAVLPLLVLPVALLVGSVRLRLAKGRTAELLIELGKGVPLGGLEPRLGRALGDPTLRLAFPAPSADGFVDANGRPVELPVADPARTVTRLEHDGELLGVLVHDPDLDADDPGLVEAVGSAASLALENERLAAQVRAQLQEVRASRSRIVEAGDAERRRVERDLHDGAQQRLVALAMRLQTAKATGAEATGLIDEATAELQTAIEEVRVLARGLHPPILTEAGLGAAIEALAERAPLTVITSVPDDRFPANVEVTAYYVVAEALTNVARHAAATEAHVEVDVRADSLIVTVRDDGRGGADPRAGTGLRGLRDRLEAIGGTLSVASPAGHGTTVTAELPR